MTTERERQIIGDALRPFVQRLNEFLESGDTDELDELRALADETQARLREAKRQIVN